jgi:YD repeat-containing protein
MTYDAMGNLLTSTEQAIAATTTFTYEPTFNQVTSIRDPKGNLTQIAYDAKGNPLTITDALNQVTTFTYNPQGLVKKPVPTIRKGGNNGANYGKSDKDALQEFENYPRSVLDIPSEGKTVHPTQKPVALMARIIELFTQPGDLVVDPYMGSGPTGVAAMRLGRRFAGCEIEPTYFATAERRIAQAAAQLRLPLGGL